MATVAPSKATCFDSAWSSSAHFPPTWHGMVMGCVRLSGCQVACKLAIGPRCSLYARRRWLEANTKGSSSPRPHLEGAIEGQ